MTLIGAVGADAFAEEALAGLRDAGRRARPPTLGGADRASPLILVDAGGETEIVVAPGANTALADSTLPEHDAVLCQLEIPDDAVASAWEQCTGVFCLQRGSGAARLGRSGPDCVVNRFELESLARRDGLVAGDARRRGRDPARGRGGGRTRGAASRRRVDGTAAGDAFTACLLVSLLEGREPHGGPQRACAAGALAASRHGAQPSLPTADEIDAIHHD